MPLKILLSAYACEPGKGSEQEVGWQWALQASRFHDVTVLTRENNRETIERGLHSLPAAAPRPSFIYHDEPAIMRTVKRLADAPRWYYLRWQRSAREVVARVHAEQRFALMHHVTYVAFRYPTAIWDHGVPTVWGPIGGAERIPAALLPWKQPRELLIEGGRNFLTRWQLSSFAPLANRTQRSSVVLAASREMQSALARLGCMAEFLPAIGIHPAQESTRIPRDPATPLRLIFVGKLVYWKGITLALEALAASGANATLTVIGEGSLRRDAELHAHGMRVEFRGRLAHEEVLAAYPEHDVLLYPSLHDSGAFTVLEAMRAGCPVICLDCGGPAFAVAEGTGLKVPLGSLAEIVGGLAAAIRTYSADRELARTHGRNAQQRVSTEFAWDRKGDALREIYARL